MEMRQCAKGGHYYDASVYSECPYCQNQAAGPVSPVSVGATMPVMQPSFTQPAAPAAPSAAQEGRTVAVVKKDLGIDPVVGWLVCTEGADRGRDYRIHSDNNFIGRSEKMDVSIRGDETISRENHAIISYDTKEKKYYFSQGEGRSIVRVNGKALFTTCELSAYDEIEIGMTKLIFIPLCGERLEWK